MRFSLSSLKIKKPSLLKDGFLIFSGQGEILKFKKDDDWMRKILVIVPAYNEESTIGGTLDNLKRIKLQHLELDVCVINDGSKDRTAEIVKSREGVSLLNLPYNLGIGGAMQTGYRYANRNNYDIAIQFDADGQHGEKDLEALIRPIQAREADVVIGSRFLEKTPYKGSTLRRIGIYYFSKLLLYLTGASITDPTSGYRAINKKVIKLFSKNYPMDYPEPEVIIKLKKKNYRLKEVTVNMRERQGGKSSITFFHSIYYVIKVSISIVLQSLRRA